MRTIEKLAVLAMLVYSTGAVLPFLAARNGGTEASTVELAVQIPLYSIAFLLILLHWQDFCEAATNVKWVLALTMVAVVSASWSQDPTFTIRRSIVLIATTLFGVYFGSRFDVDEQLRLLAWTLAIVLVASVFFALLLPHYGIDDTLHNGAWQGVFAQKNSLGRVAVLAIVVFVFVTQRMGRWLNIAGIIGCLCLLALSRSVTSVVVLGLLVCAMPLFGMIRGRYVVAIPMIVCAVAIVAIAMVYGKVSVAQILLFLHRDSHLTGRTQLWAAVLAAIARKPWFGYGFDAFWLGMRGASALIVQQLHWEPPHSHNGFLDITLEIGIFGLGIFLIGYLQLWRRALQYLRRDSGRTPLWLCMYLFFLFAYNCTERTILDQNSIFWILYTAVAVNLHLDLPVAAGPEAASDSEPVFSAADAIATSA